VEALGASTPEHPSILRMPLPGFGLGLSVVMMRQLVTVCVRRSQNGQAPSMTVVGFRVQCCGLSV